MSVDTKVTEAVAELSTVVEAAEKNKSHGEELRKLNTRLARLNDNGAEDFTEAIRAVLGADRVATYRDMLAKATELDEAISAVTSPATPEVTDLADSLRGLTEWLDERLKGEVEGVLARWDSLKPRRTMNGASSKPDLGFTVSVSCSEHGTVASTQKKNVNAIRDAVRNHHGSKHGGKFGSGDPVFVGLTTALKSVIEGGSDREKGGGYEVTKIN